MLTNKQQFELEKNIWTHADYEEMGWHDAHIYGMVFQKSEEAFTGDFLLDIDYIFKWVHPNPPDKLFTFWVAPCTLIFKECYDLRINLDTQTYGVDLLEVSDLLLTNTITQKNDVFEYDWTIDLHVGQITLKSSGFEQFVRKHPIYIDGQVLSLEQRGGISFDTEPC